MADGAEWLALLPQPETAAGGGWCVPGTASACAHRPPAPVAIVGTAVPSAHPPAHAAVILGACQLTALVYRPKPYDARRRAWNLVG